MNKQTTTTTIPEGRAKKVLIVSEEHENTFSAVIYVRLDGDGMGEKIGEGYGSSRQKAIAEAKSDALKNGW